MVSAIIFKYNNKMEVVFTANNQYTIENLLQKSLKGEVEFITRFEISKDSNDLYNHNYYYTIITKQLKINQNYKDENRYISEFEKNYKCQRESKGIIVENILKLLSTVDSFVIMENSNTKEKYFETYFIVGSNEIIKQLANYNQNKIRAYAYGYAKFDITYKTEQESRNVFGILFGLKLKTVRKRNIIIGKKPYVSKDEDYVEVVEKWFNSSFW